MVEYKGLRENSTSIMEREIKPSGVYSNMKGCILEVNFEGQGWLSRLFTFFVDSNLVVEISSKKRGYSSVPNCSVCVCVGGGGGGRGGGSNKIHQGKNYQDFLKWEWGYF